VWCRAKFQKPYIIHWVCNREHYVHHRSFMGKTCATRKRSLSTLQHHISGAHGARSVLVPCDVKCSLAVLRTLIPYTSPGRETLATGTRQYRPNIKNVRGSFGNNPRHWQRSALTYETRSITKLHSVLH